MHKLVDYFGAITIPGRFWLIFNRRGDRKEGGTFVASEIPDGVDRPSFGRRRHPGGEPPSPLPPPISLAT